MSETNQPDPAGETADESGGTLDEASAPLKPVGPEDEERRQPKPA